MSIPIAALIAVAASGCQTVAPAVRPYPQPMAVSSASLLGSWELVSVDGLAVRPKAVNVTFDRAGAFVAMVDCNRAQGYYSVRGADLSFVGWTATERGCAGPLEHEALIGAALRGDGYTVAFPTSRELHLSGAHKVIFRRM
jgi:heat shock protein HslJ